MASLATAAPGRALRWPALSDTAPWAIGGFVGLSLLANAQLTSKLYVTHLAQLVLLWLAVAVWLLRKPPMRVRPGLLPLALVLAAYALAVVQHSLPQPYVREEGGKIALMLVTWLAFTMLDPAGRRLDLYLRVFVAALLIACVGRLFATGFNSLATGRRFEIPTLGSYNALGFLLGAATFFSLFLHDRGERLLSRATWTVAGVLSGSFLILTFSRGGTLAAMAALVAYLLQRRKRRAAYVVALLATALAIAFVTSVLLPDNLLAVFLRRFSTETDGTGSNRTLLWTWLVVELLAHPGWLALGRGIGSIDLAIGPSYYRSAHNTYLELLYYLGIPGLLAFGWLLYRMGRRLSHAPAPLQDLLRPILALLVVSIAVDSYYGTSQIGWFTAFLFYMLWIPTALPQSLEGRSGPGAPELAPGSPPAA